MKTICALLLALLLPAVCAAQNAPAARTDVYHVHFAKATLGKAAEEGDFLKTPSPNAPMPAHHLVLRHQDGEDWDYVAIEHIGPKATVDAAGRSRPPSVEQALCSKAVVGRLGLPN